jgi:hypothetical protein
MVAWDVAKREDAQVAADLVGRACLRERISKGRRRGLVQPPEPPQQHPVRDARSASQWKSRLVISPPCSCVWAGPHRRWSCSTRILRHTLLLLKQPNEKKPNFFYQTVKYHTNEVLPFSGVFS